MVRREDKKKRKNSELMNDDGKMTVYIGNSARKTKMIPILRDLVMGVRKKDPVLPAVHLQLMFQSFPDPVSSSGTGTGIYDKLIHCLSHNIHIFEVL